MQHMVLVADGYLGYMSLITAAWMPKLVGWVLVVWDVVINRC